MINISSYINIFRTEFGLIFIGALIFTASFLWKDLLTDIENIIVPKSGGIAPRILFTMIVSIMLVSSAVLIRNFFNITNEQAASNMQFDDSPGGGDD